MSKYTGLLFPVENYHEIGPSGSPFITTSYREKLEALKKLPVPNQKRRTNH